MRHIKRNLGEKAELLLKEFPIICILGARQVGKTSLAKALRPNWRYFDLENTKNYQRIQDDIDLFFQQNNKDLIIDEAQILPDLFKTLRGVIDEQRDVKGRFIITGSSSPELKAALSESLAGRIATIELGTLKANEIAQQELSPFYNIFLQKINNKNLVSGPPLIDNATIQSIWLKGGYPEPVLGNNPDFFARWMAQYLDSYVHRDLSILFPKLNKIAYQRLIYILSKLSGTILNQRDLARALEVSAPTIKEYLQILQGTYIWRNINSFEKNIVKAIIKMPKGYLRDCGLLHFLLNINNLEDLYNNPICGFSFEAFVIEEIIKGLQAINIENWHAYYYRTRKGAEIDLILDGPFGLLPIEIKYGTTIKPKHLQTLESFVQEHDLPFGLLINQGDRAEWITPEVFQLPVGWV